MKLISRSQALLEIAPAYFEHMATTHNKATALAKIVGFYTVKMHDVATGEKRTMDLLVMENLFWKQEIDRTFDLKGIEARRVPKGKENGSTMFDAEWLEAQATSPLFVHPHAKRILLDSLTTDTRFLSCQSIIDYSLLLGLDRSRSELVVGLVDAVGSYGLFKNLESIGKVALNRGREGEVTIIPPDQYRERFETALRSYFTACPDKWSRSPKRTGAVTSELPVVF
ncbi:phosphatidylinositol-4-phosphate 5-kinase [Dioszegia hungarica]|uniref:Phosphatidylinositol-4-phosphate 5-kinase n=1 Tax=Dioszegia hungarica TaxID=4972 RepID=A0AA38H9T5_9TREE|nr:phosphatidylinositol-4-phosphate 5-kinase [Dioszegia hungarica]KAI9635199.1 phosphatidylinositol-4-phosphate 5-kinase [Dioszegia hungarica]